MPNSTLNAEIDATEAEIYSEKFSDKNVTASQEEQSNGVTWAFSTILQNKANITLTISP